MDEWLVNVWIGGEWMDGVCVNEGVIVWIGGEWMDGWWLYECVSGEWMDSFGGNEWMDK